MIVALEIGRRLHRDFETVAGDCYDPRRNIPNYPRQTELP